MLSKGFATCFDEDAFEPKEKYINLFEISTYNIYNRYQVAIQMCGTLKIDY